MALPNITQPTWVKVATFDPGVQLSSMFTDIKSNLTTLNSTVTKEYTERRQVFDKATTWLGGIKSEVASKEQSLRNINNSIATFGGYTNNVLEKQDTLVQSITTIDTFLGQFLTATGLVISGLSIIPNLGSGFIPQAQGLLNNLNDSVRSEANTTNEVIKGLTPGPDFGSQVSELFKGFTNFVQTALSNFGDSLMNTPEVVAAPPEQQQQVSAVSADYTGTFNDVVSNVGKAISEGVTALQNLRPINIIQVPPLNGGLVAVSDAIIKALGEEGVIT